MSSQSHVPHANGTPRTSHAQARLSQSASLIARTRRQLDELHSDETIESLKARDTNESLKTRRRPTAIQPYYFMTALDDDQVRVDDRPMMSDLETAPPLAKLDDTTKDFGKEDFAKGHPSSSSAIVVTSPTISPLELSPKSPRTPSLLNRRQSFLAATTARSVLPDDLGDDESMGTAVVTDDDDDGERSTTTPTTIVRADKHAHPRCQDDLPARPPGNYPACCSCHRSRARCEQSTSLSSTSPASSSTPPASSSTPPASSSTCPCVRAGRPCRPSCETGVYACDCLNTALTTCKCKDSTTCATSSSQCECHAYQSTCNPSCACFPECLDRAQHAPTAKYPTATGAPPMNPPKTLPPPNGCRCKRNSCQKWAKCPCRQALAHCTDKCKCAHGKSAGECSNERDAPLGAKVKQYFMAAPTGMPTSTTTGGAFTSDSTTNHGVHTAQGSAAVVVLVGGTAEEPYSYKFDVSADAPKRRSKGTQHVTQMLVGILHQAANRCRLPDIQTITVFMSRSPCYHQTCQPPCEVVQQCTDYACSRLLAVAYGQLRRQLTNAHLGMTVKFMAPNVRRGDLYTQQGIVHMLRSGIAVCPLVMNDWVDVVANHWTAHMPPVPRTQPVTVDTETQRRGIRLCAQRQWRDSHLDRLVDQCQLYINVCRQSLGLHPVYWSSLLHDHIVQTAQTAIASQAQFAALASKLRKLHHQYGSTVPTSSTGTPTYRTPTVPCPTDICLVNDRNVYDMSASEHTAPRITSDGETTTAIAQQRRQVIRAAPPKILDTARAMKTSRSSSGRPWQRTASQSPRHSNAVHAPSPIRLIDDEDDADDEQVDGNYFQRSSLMYQSAPMPPPPPRSYTTYDIADAIAHDCPSSALVPSEATNGNGAMHGTRGRQLVNNASTQRSTSMNPSMRMGTQSMHSYHKPVNMVMMITPNRHTAREAVSLSDESQSSPGDPTGAQLEQEIIEHLSTRSMTAGERFETCARLLAGVNQMNDELVNLLRYLRSTSRVGNL